MRKILIAFALILAFYSCNKNDEEKENCNGEHSGIIYKMDKTDAYRYIYLKHKSNGKTYIMTATKEQWSKYNVGNEICDWCAEDESGDGIFYCD